MTLLMAANKHVRAIRAIQVKIRRLVVRYLFYFIKTLQEKNEILCCVNDKE